MKPTRVIVLTWLAWVLILIAFQALATARLVPQFPDRAQDWTERFAGEAGYQEGHIYLLEPFMNNQVAWDSEYYLAIATGGYDNPYSPHLTPFGVITATPDQAIAPTPSSSFGKSLSLSYAFFPFYPLLIRIFAFPLQVFGLNAIATATLAGVIVSALGALLGMLALYELTRDSLGEEGAQRAAFYLIIFPTGFFLVQVYTEGLFVGLAFACLAMLKRRQWMAAALLGVAATMTRAVGIALIIPMVIVWLRTGEWAHLEWRQILQNGILLRLVGRALLVFSPLFAFLIWKFSYLGIGFDYIESNYFRRGFLQLGDAYYAWADAFKTMLSGTNPQHTAYYATEFLGLALGIVACIATMKTYPEIAWFGAAVMLISWGSVTPQGIHRYILGAPAVFIALARWGKDPAFDRAWTILSILLMGLLAMLFAFNMWVA